MKPAWLAKFSPTWRARMVRLIFNLNPAFRGTGGRVVHVAKDMRHIRIHLPLSWKTRNIVGSLYGGSLFAITDGAHPMMLWAALGDGYVIWDKAASIRYRKPGYSTLYADFELPDSELAEIHAALAQTPELERTYTVKLKDQHGTVHTEVSRTVYIADKNFYRQKIAGREHSICNTHSRVADHEPDATGAAQLN